MLDTLLEKNLLPDWLIRIGIRRLLAQRLREERARYDRAAYIADLKQRGIKDADKAPIPEELFRPQAERRVRLGLVVAELVKAHNLQATAEQIKDHIEELAASYEQPADVVRWYNSDNRRLAEVEAVVIENNVTNYVLSLAKVSEKTISFDELMGQSA